MWMTSQSPEIKQLLAALGITSLWEKVVIELNPGAVVRIYVKRPLMVTDPEAISKAASAILGKVETREVTDVEVTDHCTLVITPNE